MPPKKSVAPACSKEPAKPRGRRSAAKKKQAPKPVQKPLSSAFHQHIFDHLLRADTKPSITTMKKVALSCREMSVAFHGVMEKNTVYISQSKVTLKRSGNFPERGLSSEEAEQMRKKEIEIPVKLPPLQQIIWLAPFVRNLVISDFKAFAVISPNARKSRRTEILRCLKFIELVGRKAYVDSFSVKPIQLKGPMPEPMTDFLKLQLSKLVTISGPSDFYSQLPKVESDEDARFPGFEVASVYCKQLVNVALFFDEKRIEAKTLNFKITGCQPPAIIRTLQRSVLRMPGTKKISLNISFHKSFNVFPFVGALCRIFPDLEEVCFELEVRRIYDFDTDYLDMYTEMHDLYTRLKDNLPRLPDNLKVDITSTAHRHSKCHVEYLMAYVPFTKAIQPGWTKPSGDDAICTEVEEPNVTSNKSVHMKFSITPCEIDDYEYSDDELENDLHLLYPDYLIYGMDNDFLSDDDYPMTDDEGEDEDEEGEDEDDYDAHYAGIDNPFVGLLHPEEFFWH